MVADRAGASGSGQALLMMMRVASPVGRRIARVLLVRPFAALVWQAIHCHLVRSHLAFAIVADGFDRTSFHGFLANRLLLRGGRLLKHIGVAAVVAAREISGCGFPAQVAVNALVIDVKRSGHVFRVFIRNVGHRILFRFMQTEIR